MKTCTIDNPVTLQRECWQDGKLICSYHSRLFLVKHITPIPPEIFFLGANVRDWKTSQYFGNIEALSEEMQTELSKYWEANEN